MENIATFSFFRLNGIIMTEIKVGKVNEINEGEMKFVSLQGSNAVLTKINGKIYCMEGDCSHAGGPLWEGELEGNTVTCPWHGGQFDITTGKVLRPPAFMPKKTYQVKVVGNDVFVVV